MIAGIQVQEIAHLQEARDHKVFGLARRLGIPVISAATSLVIWLSTWGDSTWMEREMKAAT